MEVRMKKIIAVSLLVLFLSACTSRIPILYYKDSAESNPQKLPLRAGLKIENAQAIGDNVNVKGGMGTFLPLIPLYLYTFHAEFPKGKEAEFMADMIRQYFVDSGIFDYIYPFPFKNTDVDIIVNLKLNKFVLKNSKSWNYIKNSIFPIIPVIGSFLPFILTNEKYSAQYDFTAQILLPNGKLIKEYNVFGVGKESVSFGKEPYGKYLFYNSIFKKKFLQLMDEIKAKIIMDRDPIIQSYKNFLVD